MTLTIINFSHPLTEQHQEAIAAMSGHAIGDVIECPANFDTEKPFVPQAETLLDSVGFSSTEWQTVPILVNLPALSTIAAVVLAMISGRRGHLPAIVRVKPVRIGVVTAFEVGEVLNLEEIRGSQRNTRGC